MTSKDRWLIGVGFLLALAIGISTFVVNSAAREAALDAYVARQEAAQARKAATAAVESIEDHRLGSERRSTELANFISCALAILPEDRTSASLKACERVAGINESRTGVGDG